MRRVLVANRGEIATRVIRACADEGVTSVAALSAADIDSLPGRLADHAVCIGPASADRSYLSVGSVVSAALLAGCDAVHPGYGFLSEQPALPEACDRHGLAFVGPRAETIRRGGDKTAARALARSLGIPVGAGSDHAATAEDAARVAEEVGYPLLLKAAAGGGGRGMALVADARELADVFDRASREASQAFGDGRLYVERYVTNARHVEVQVLADVHGNLVHLGERDCSCQRRYQKLVEEAPSPAVSPALRAELTDAALTLARALEYTGAGTVEFLLDLDRGTFGFLEVNTRVQVEHPVTEMVTGIDIVREQLRIAAGEPLSFSQADVVFSGHAIECRINAEDADFRPAPGRITAWTPPQGEGIRVDTHCESGYLVPPHYDSLLAKLVCHGEDRDAAAVRMSGALARFGVESVPTTIDFHRRLIDHLDFRGARVTTRWVEHQLMTGSAR